MHRASLHPWNGTSFTSSFLLTIGALGAWAQVPGTLGPAFGSYHGGQHGVCLYLTVVSAVLISIILVFEFMFVRIG